MSRRVFLSFLGFNRYIPCNYCFEDGFVSENSRFVQRSIFEYLVKEEPWQNQDSAYVFLTKGAHDNNWKDENWKNLPDGPKYGLYKEVESLEIPFRPIGLGTPENPFMPEGTSQEEIFQIFARIEALIQPDDQVYIDITHGFRSLPMLFMVLINYIKVTKGATVRGVYYGAFEKLGTARDVSNMDLADRNAPVLNLLPLVSLLEWGQGADAFLRYGYADGLLAAIDGHDHQDLDITEMREQLADISSIFKTTRGKDIIDGGTFIRARDLFQRFVGRSDVVPAMVPLKRIVQRIATALEPFQRDDVNNMFDAVTWLEKNQDLHQMMTLVREGIVSVIERAFQEDLQVVESKKQRTLVEHSLSIVGYKIKERKWHSPTTDHPELSRRMRQYIQARAPKDRFAKVYCRLGDLRNDTNHAGFRPNPLRAAELREKFDKYYDELKRILNSDGDA